MSLRMQNTVGKTEEENGGGEDPPAGIWDCGSPLYDSFELASFCHVLDRHTMKLPFSLSKSTARISASIEPVQGEREAATAAMGDAGAVRMRMKKKEKKTWRWRTGVGVHRIRCGMAFWKKLSE
ncbi:hypothetical protein HPP92_007437 [Vanilla planifolia]|uniref:Uncharacterized protein n=1 Tax=Vanilla planifolia TaxID=51239 RepID=A0A835RKA1_VANPL|nr:hypothetical protein HPP92_007437 [Vanilla planifolia]